MNARPRPETWLVAIVVLAAVVAACQPERGEVKPWQPADHDHPTALRPGNNRQTPQNAANKNDTTQLAADVWGKACTRCHGPRGKGDGPEGKQRGAPDLTRQEWLESVTDEDIAKVIREGKGANMPANPDLPDVAIKALVGRIRGRGK